VDKKQAFGHHLTPEYFTNINTNMNQKPSGAFVAASWIALGVGMFGYLTGLFRQTCY